MSVNQQRLQPLTLTDVHRLSDGITICEWLSASLTSAIAMRSLKGCKAVIRSCRWDLIGTETTILRCLALPPVASLRWLIVTSFAIIEEAKKWTQGRDAGRYDGEVELETEVLMLKKYLKNGRNTHLPHITTGTAMSMDCISYII